MARRSIFSMLLRRVAPPAALLLVGAFFGSYAIFGPNGALAYGTIERQLADQQQTLALLAKHRAALRNCVQLLNPSHVDPDLAEELARKDMGVADPDDVIMPLGNGGPSVGPCSSRADKS